MPKEGIENVTRLLNISRSSDGFFMEMHPKLRPIDTTVDGIFLAGCCQSPKDIPDSVAQASAAASNVCSLISKKKTEGEVCTSEVNEELCIGCATCHSLCPYGAVEMVRNGTTWRARIIEIVCKGCGTCASECPARAINVRHFKDDQIIAQVEGILEEV